MEQYWKSIWEKKDVTPHIKWLVDLTVDHINLPKQETVQITKTETVH